MPGPLILFAHGAGAPSSSAWMREWAGRLETLGEVVAFDYPYMKAGRKAPDKLPVLVAAHGTALDEARARVGQGRPVVLAGKSMGSRIGCHLAVQRRAAGEDVPAALICFGYPLRAAGSGILRDEVLRALTTPILFLQGARDPLCPIPDLEKVRAEMTAPSTLHVVPGGNHSLESGRPKPGAPRPCDDAVLEAIRGFLAARGLIP
jgi:predicted alpha/beta-hydrolase family hydrolase